MKADNTEAMVRIQQSIDSIEKRMRVDSNDLDYETHLRQKRQLQQILDRMKARNL
ncbi:MAG: aminoglycoside phosphotransferase [Selenomonas ruminantium]|jgi:predicted  nucleic acid-binding Zn-ribbon protein|nr:aminoglycoside phosphotransferase [Selenomonas ruminantium]